MNEIAKGVIESKLKVHAFLLFESCEERIPRINGTIRAMGEMLGAEFGLSSICRLTGCTELSIPKIANRHTLLS